MSLHLKKFSVKKEIKNYLQMAKNGHLPLFFNDWIRENNTPIKMTYKKANENLSYAFENLARHKSFDKKKTAMLSMPKDERNELISSFVKIMELNTLKETRTLH